MKIMKKYGQTIFTFILFTFSIGYCYGQALTCNNLTQLALDGAGEYVIYPETILEGGPYDYDNMQVYNYQTGEGGTFLLVDCNDIGNMQVQVKDITTGNSCWGTVIIEDKLPPLAIVEDSITISMYGGGSITIPPAVVNDGSYDNCSIQSTTISPNTFTEEGVYPVTFTVTDQSGLSNMAVTIVTVEKGTPSCVEDVPVSLIWGPATVEASVFVEGNATYDVLEVSRDNVNFGQTVIFDCNDMNEDITVYVHIEQDGVDFNCTSTASVISSIPVAVAKQNIEIALSSGGGNGDITAKIYAESIDNGSYDICSDVKLEIRRDIDNCGISGNATYNADGHLYDGSPNPASPVYDTDDGDFVKFCCDDLYTATVDVNGDGVLDPGYVRVWLRVWNDADADGSFGSAGDNYNETWTNVKIIDLLPPVITCPADVTLTCDMNYTDLSLTGTATAIGLCGEVDVEYHDIIVNVNSCGEGFVLRRYNPIGRPEIFCDQRITMEALDEPVTVSFSQLQNATLTGCPSDYDLGEPTWTAGPCDVLGYTIETDSFFFEDGVCLKLIHYWTVINWCKYTPNDPDWNGEGLWEHTQVINIEGCTLDDIVFPHDIDIYDENGTPDNLTVENLQSVYGYAFKDVHPYTFVDCGTIFYSYTDVQFSIPFGWKIVRTWTALDWETEEVVEYNQVLKLTYNTTNSLACNDNITVSVTIENPVTIYPDDVLEGGPYNLNNMTLVLTDNNNEEVEDNIVTVDYIGQVLIYEVTDSSTGNTCWGHITVEQGPGDCLLEDDDLTYPLEIIEVADSNVDPALLTPEYLISTYGYDTTDVLFTWPDDDCYFVASSYEDNVLNLPGGNFKIERSFMVIDWFVYDPGDPNWDGEGVWTFTQIIVVGTSQESLICDFLPRTSPVGDCESGHTLEDDVEWPADLSIADHRIEPEELIDFSDVDPLDASPSYYNNPGDYSADFVDLLVDISPTTLIVGRVWTVEHAIFEFKWTYTQDITIDITDFSNLVTVNTGTNRAMPQVMINESIVTNTEGLAYVEDPLINSVVYDDDFFNGINVLDILLIQAHILNVIELDGFSLKAADFDGDELIKAADLAALRKVLIGEVEPPQEKWRFYENEMEGPLTVEPKGVYEGIKAGDVDDSALLPGEIPPPSDADLVIEDILLNKGEVYSVPVWLEEGSFEVLGFEFRADFDTDLIEIVDVENDYDKEVSYHINENGLLRLVFSSPSDPFQIDGNLTNPVCTIRIQAKENSLLSQAMGLENHQSYMASSEYDLIILGAEIDDVIGTSVNSPELAGLSVFPNPATTYLNFDLNKVDVKGSFEIRLFDALGREVDSHMNTEKVDVRDLNSGVYYYRLKLNEFTTTGKFIISR